MQLRRVSAALGVEGAQPPIQARGRGGKAPAAAPQGGKRILEGGWRYNSLGSALPLISRNFNVFSRNRAVEPRTPARAGQAGGAHGGTPPPTRARGPKAPGDAGPRSPHPPRAPTAGPAQPDPAPARKPDRTPPQRPKPQGDGGGGRPGGPGGGGRGEGADARAGR